MKRFPLFWLNVGMALVLSTSYALVLRWERVAPEIIASVFRQSWWAGLLVGLAVAVGATVGPRPALGWKKCVRVQLLIVATTAIGALIAWLLPKPWAEVDRAVEEAMTRRGLSLGSGIGAFVGTAIQMVQVYFARRRAARSK